MSTFDNMDKNDTETTMAPDMEPITSGFTTTDVTTRNYSTTVLTTSSPVTTVELTTTTTAQTTKRVITRLPEIVDTPKTPLIESYFDELIENLRKLIL